MAVDEIKVGATLRQAADEVAAAWKAAEAGEPHPATDKLYFTDWTALCAVLTPKRYELLRHLRCEPADNFRSLATALGRDVKNVHASPWRNSGC